MTTTAKPSSTPTFQFFREVAYAKSGGVKRPSRIVLARTTERKWSARNIVGECLRERGYCPHVGPDVQLPVHVYGIPPSAWKERLNTIEKNAAEIRVPYTRGGQTGRRKLKSDTPIVLMAVASHPSAPDAPSPERDRWQSLVIDAARQRFGDRLRSIVAHVDESYYHLHLWIDDDGRPVKRLHSGHAAALEVSAAGGTRAAQGAAYKRGCREMLNWFASEVGEKMGWRRESEAPAPRAPRAAVIARRLREAEAAEVEAAKQAEAVRVAAGEVAEKGRLARAQMEQSQRDREDLRASYAELQAQRAEVEALHEAITDPDIQAMIRAKQSAVLMANRRP